jgi:hypothetical protein
MSRFKSKVAVASIAGALAVGSLGAPLAFADGGGGGDAKKCNAGRGNGSEGCDPGKSSTAADGSAGQNMGGDEGGPISGGTGAP